MARDQSPSRRMPVVALLVGAIVLAALARWGFAVARAGGAPALARASAAAPGGSQPPAAAASPQASFTSSLDAIEREAAALPAASTDPAAQAATLGATMDAAFAFVRDQVNDEVYAGVLRGARGALLARAGNSCDKSLLLASLLRARGFTVRFVRGRLAPDRAALIVDQMFASVPKRGRLTTPAPQTGEPPARVRARTLVGDWNANAEEIQAVLRRDGVALAQTPPTPRSTLIAEASDHTWIEVQQGGSWTALDPSFRDAKPGQTFGQSGATADDLPPALAHTITIRLVAEERTGSTLASHDVLRYRNSAAALNGTPVVLNTQLVTGADGWTATPFIQVGDRLFTGLPFTTRGVTTTTTGGAAASAASAAAQAFGSGPAPAAPQGDLAAVWIVVEFRAPDGHTDTVRRAVLDRIGPPARMAHRESGAPLAPIVLMNGRPVALSGLYACAFSAGGFPAGFAAAEIASKVPLLRGAAPLAAAIAGGRELTSDERTRAADQLAPALATVLHASALAFYRGSQAGLELVRSEAPVDVWFYDAAPRLVITSLELMPASDGKTVRLQASVDLRKNDMRTVSADPNGSQVIWANVLRGILDGALEQALFGGAAPPNSQLVRAGSTVALFSDARAANDRRLTLRTSDAVAHLDLPDGARARMQEALESGRTALVAPERALASGGTPRVGWWQIDLDTGETLGVLDSGLHQEFEEYEETTMVSRAWTGPAPKPTVWSIETTHGAIVATSEEAGLAAYGEELAKEVAYMLRFMK